MIQLQCGLLGNVMLARTKDTGLVWNSEPWGFNYVWFGTVSRHEWIMVWFGTMGAVHGSVMFGLELKGCKNDGVVWNYIGAVRGSRSCEALGAYLNTPTNSYAQTPHNKLNLRIYYFCICTREYTVHLRSINKNHMPNPPYSTYPLAPLMSK